MLYVPSIILASARNPITAIGLPLALGMLSGSHTRRVVDGQWYQNLAVPPGRPPRVAFPIVWPLLYISMGYASHLAVKTLDMSVTPSARSNLTTAVAVYYAQLGLNCLWSPLFFKAKRTGWALVDSVLLTVLVCYMTDLLNVSTSSKTTPFLLPYCAWLTYATYLNCAIWWLNRRRALPKKD